MQHTKTVEKIRSNKKFSWNEEVVKKGDKRNKTKRSRAEKEMCYDF